MRLQHLFPLSGEPTALFLSFFIFLPACAPESGQDAQEAAAVSHPERPGQGVEPQAYSLFGEALYEMEDTTGAIADADSALARDPDNLEKIIAAARVRRNFWHYRQAMELYTRAIEQAPDDWRPYRYRGHRHISLREFEAAIQDLEKARSLAPMNWDVAYHLGLAYYVSGDFQKAFMEYRRCLDLASDQEAEAADGPDFRSCSRNGDDPESRVAMTEWAVRAGVRSGHGDEARAILAAIPTDLEVEENIAYYHDLLFYKGELSEEALLNPGPDAPYRRETVGYGVANWTLAQGDTARAVALLEELVQDPWWPGFGRIASEADLWRLTDAGARRP